MKTIFLPTDFSACADHAADYAIKLFADEGVRFCLFHGLEIQMTAVEGVAMGYESMASGVEERLGKLTQDFMVRLQGTPSIVTARILTGTSRVQLIRQGAEEAEADFVVMGVETVQGIWEWLEGSTTRGVARQSKLPLIAVPAQATLALPKSILFAADLQTMEHENVLDPLIVLARKHASKIDLLTVRESGELIGVEAAQEGLYLHNKLQDLKHDYHMLEGEDPVKQIESYIRSHPADLLVSVARHRSWWEQIFHSSVTGQLVEKCPVPMLVLHDN